MKRLLTATILVTGALGAQAQTVIDTARVRSAEPQYETTRVPRQECTNRWRPGHGDRHSQAYQDQDQYQNQDAQRSYGGAVLGGLAGGVLGNQVGGGNGKVAATALGAVLGAFAGDNFDNRNARPTQNYPAQVYQTGGRGEERCQTVYETQSQLTGYQVVYEYRGQNYSTFMRNNPGNRLRVRVSVEPIQE
jgi:uncharacterized protein YcfJ